MPSALPILDVHASAPLEALFEAVRRRAAGEHFLARVLVDHPRSVHAAREAVRILERFQDHDDRLEAFDALAREQRFRPLNRRVAQTMREVVLLADALASRSFFEHSAAELILEFTAPAVYVDAEPDVAVPAFTASDARDAIVVWAPTWPARDLALVAFALEDLHAEVFVVCAGGKHPAMRAQFVTYEDAAAVLPRARVLVDPSLQPGNALALARCGLPLAASLSTGAIEFLDGMTLYAPWDRADVLRAVQSALGAAPPRLRERALVTSSPGAAGEAGDLDGPLVSIVVRTYDRPEFLQRALNSIARQTYRNIEIVVVNDAGRDVGEIVAAYEHARLIVHESNRGAIAAANTGLHASRGEYVGLLDDDDVLFPDHVATVVTALRRSAASVAHADVVAAFYDVDEDPHAPYGYSIFLNKIGEPTDLYVSDGIGPMAALFRRAAALEAGGYDEAFPHAEDWDLLIRLAQRHDFVHVPRVTAMYCVRNDGSNMMSYNVAGFRRAMQLLVEKYPLEARPSLARLRSETMSPLLRESSQPAFPQPAMKRA